MASRVSAIRALRRLIRRGIRWALLYEDEPVQVNPFFVESSGLGPAAEARAMQLLLRMLDPVQHEELLRYGYFTVHVVSCGSFRILRRSMFNVLNTQTGISYCAGPDAAVPVPDLMLAQKLVLENEPARFFRVANHRKEDGRNFALGI